MTNSLDLKDIIGAPLRAIIEGEALAAQSTVDFIKTIGFLEPKPGTDFFGSLRMITFTYQKPNLNPEIKENQTFQISVPLLSIIPIPLIQISTSEIEFALNITETETKGTSPILKSVFQNLSKTENYQMKVKINIQQADVPVGLSKIFGIMEQTLLEKQM
jgi:hypothetical protein